MSEKSTKNIIPNWQDPKWIELVNRDAKRSFGGGEMTPFSPPEVRNPSEINFSPVDEAKIIGEARINKKLTK
jgi:hypothetical protein